MFALVNIAGRLSEYGFSANKTAALGLNLILLVNLTWSAWLLVRFIRSRGGFDRVEHWQTRYLPVYALWAAFVVVAFRRCSALPDAALTGSFRQKCVVSG